MGVREQIIFPEIDYDAVDQVRGLDITITTSASTDAEAFALLEAFGFPFSQEGRPKLPGDPAPESEAAAAEPTVDIVVEDPSGQPVGIVSGSVLEDDAGNPVGELIIEEVLVEDESGAPTAVIEEITVEDLSGNVIATEILVEEVTGPELEDSTEAPTDAASPPEDDESASSPDETD
jgi:hypothetical protein